VWWVAADGGSWSSMGVCLVSQPSRRSSTGGGRRQRGCRVVKRAASDIHGERAARGGTLQTSRGRCVWLWVIVPRLTRQKCKADASRARQAGQGEQKE
jgi:hypothetical protein